MKATGEEQHAPSLLTLRWVALALLIAMALLYIVSVVFQAHHVGWHYARAFTEAAMVGGLADWFAVTAIFRHPFGIPVPHTAVIPRNKGRIADALGDFVAVNFLAPDIVRKRLQDQDLAASLALQITDPATAQRIANGIIDALPSIADLLNDEAVNDFIRRQVTALSRDGGLPEAIGRGLRLLTDQGRHHALLDAALAEGWRAMEDHEAAIRAQVRARTSWAWRLISLDARASDALIGAIADTLRAMASDPDHPARQRITTALHTFSDDLQNSPELRLQIERIVADVLAHPSVTTYFQTLWAGLKDRLRESAGAPHSTAHQSLADTIARIGAELQSDTEAQEALDRRLRKLLTEFAARHGRDIALLISETIRGWDSKTIVEKLEHNVGPDLQFIRINGTVIGGLIGVIIYHATSMLTAGNI
jgi:uncharacterized membrane-anchored protein YjiN (DUF445 family)